MQMQPMFPAEVIILFWGLLHNASYDSSVKWRMGWSGG